MKYICLIVISLMTACASPIKQNAETNECINYRHMMTAPMSPHAMERLRQACLDSKNIQE